MHNFINRILIITLFLRFNSYAPLILKHYSLSCNYFRKKKTSGKSNKGKPRNHFISKKSMNTHVPEVPWPPLIYFHCIMILVWTDGILRNECWILPSVAYSNILKSFYATVKSSSVLTGVSEITLCTFKIFFFI